MRNVEAPALPLLALEPVRALSELFIGRLLRKPLLRLCPPGDGHPVLVLPGLGASDLHTAPLRNFLRSLGYAPCKWGQGLNVGPRKGLPSLLDSLHCVLERKGVSPGRPCSVIGWSLGGVYARELAKQRPDIVRQVITLGTPFTGSPRFGTNAYWLYGLLSGRTPEADADLLESVKVPPPVPCTSIFSKTDGVVGWHCSTAPAGPCYESVELSLSSHCGMVANPLVQWVIANRLAQPETGWRPFSWARQHHRRVDPTTRRWRAST